MLVMAALKQTVIIFKHSCCSFSLSVSIVGDAGARGC